ncbi:YlbF family regulator [Anaerotalea alkaliphila]|uniref:YlbF family regulator n=1 Tax=Anaerotalea alkaliphila TaxID=2662126 RepID=A0A7X5HX38_9FIRM|nr:YlbF family regulator [Anaerotalea alkaliphila]NDL68226.1 YlbF family regulator [Anaerotalea alkaliphila]
MHDKMINEIVEFADKIKKSPTYIDYLNYRSLLEAHPELLRDVNEFRRRSFEIQISHNYGVYNAYENLVHLKDEYDTLLGNPVVKEFLAAELKLSKMISHVFESIADELDFDVDFLN